MPEENTFLEGFEIPENFELPNEEPEVEEVKDVEEPEVEKLKEEEVDPKKVAKDLMNEPDDEELEVPENNDEEPESNEDTGLFSTLAEALKEQGLFNTIEDTSSITDVDKLTEAFRKEIKSNEFSDLNDTQKKVLEAFRQGVPTEDILQHEQTQHQLMSITEEQLSENEELRKNIIMTDLKAKGVSDNRANKLYQAMYDAGEDIDEAKESLKLMQEQEQIKYNEHVANIQKQQKDANDAKQKEFNKLKDNISNIDKFLGEIPVTEKIRENVQKAMSIPVDYLEDGTPVNKLMKARIDDPITFETNLYYLFELTNGFKDLDIFSKRATSKATKKLSEAIGNSTFIKSSGKPTYQQDSDSYSGSEIVEF